MKLLWAPFLLSLAAAAIIPDPGQKIDYSGFKFVRVPAGEDRVRDEVNRLALHVFNPGFDELDVVVPPEDAEALKRLVSGVEILDEDVGATIAEEGQFSTYAVPSPDWFTSYHSYADHTQFLRDLQGSFTSRSSLFTAGSSVQGRPINGIHIFGAGGAGSRPAILFHGTVHAREWITTMTVEYMAYQLLTRYASDSAVKALVDKFDFYILPVVNPDGFLYSQTNDRLWRKNRSPAPSGSSCLGTDVNRNWPYKWGGQGSSSNPCSETYRGVSAGDSPENKGLVAQVNSLKASRGISLYIDFHSYGQYILWPYGYDCSARAENDAQHNTIAQAARSAIAAPYGTQYTIGPSCQTLYATTGSSVDHLDVVGNSTYSYTYELRPRSGSGSQGFVLPANQIQPTVIETYAGVIAMLQRV